MLSFLKQRAVSCKGQSSSRGPSLIVGVIQRVGVATFVYTRKSEESKVVTAEDLGRRLKSAAQNFAKDIPIIKSAIGYAVKQITEKKLEKPLSQDPAKQNY